MPTTTKGFVYPSNSDNVDIPGDMQALAESIDTAVITATSTTTLTNKTLTSPNVNNALVRAPFEDAVVSATAATGTINFDVKTQGILYYTSNATANHTINVRGDSTTTLASLLSTGDSITIVWMNTNGATAYYPNTFQVDGSSQTVKWQGGTAVAAGNASAIDVYQYTIIKTAATPTYVVLGSQTKFA